MIVSATTPGETVLACVTTATCWPQGQYHFSWSPLPCFHVQPCASSACSTSRYFMGVATVVSLVDLDSECLT